MNWEPLILTFELAAITTILLFFIAVPIAYGLTYAKFPGKPIVEALISMPLVLPPTVLGFYFLMAFAPNSWLGSILNDYFGIQLVFSFGGLVIASMIYSLPFMVQPIRSGFSSLPVSLKEASSVMGSSRSKTLFRVLLPNIRPSLLAGIVLAFAHTVGEFGVVLMIGGNIPGETRVASIAIYDEVEKMNYASAETYSLILFAITFFILLGVYLVNGRSLQSMWK